MSNVKIYTAVSEDLSPPIHGEWFCVDMVRYSDYAALEAKCAALAAELSQAKSVVSECREYFIAGIMNRIRPTNEGYLHMRCDTLGDETPSHDAFLAEVRAQGAEECVRQLVISDDDDFSDAPNICAMVAHQLRQEAAQ